MLKSGESSRRGRHHSHRRKEKENSVKYIYYWIWDCCSCGGQGGMTTEILHCPDVYCGHIRCENFTYFCFWPGSNSIPFTQQVVPTHWNFTFTDCVLCMENLHPYSDNFKQYAFKWKAEFGERHERIYGKPLEADRFVERHGASTKDEIIDKFVRTKCQHDVDRYWYRSRLLEGFLRHGDLEMIQQPLSTGTSSGQALLDDRNDASATRGSTAGNLRRLPEPLTSCGLYHELLRPRIGLADHPNAERRTVYITDLGSSYALALAATVSPRQVEFLRDFMYKHLACRALIGVEVPPTGSATFALEFHLPYYAWRKMDPMARDVETERHVEEKRLRRSEEVIPLRIIDHDHAASQLAEDDRTIDHIHEAQISFMVTGIDDWFWTAYTFVDIYFKDEDNTESAAYYSRTSPGKPPLDPHSCGQYDANKPVWNPRHLFLRSLSCRMEQVKQEWNNVIFQLFQQIDPCIYMFTRGEGDLSDAAQFEITQQPGFKWTIRVLRQFTHLLSKTIDAWETFRNGEIRYFNQIDGEALAEVSWGRYLAAIDKDVTELRDLRSSLIHQTELFENMTNSIVTHAQHAESIITRLQSEFIQALTVITILYLPATLASTIFSMQNPIFSNPRLVDWIATLVALSVFTTFLVLNLPHIRKFGSPIRAWNDRMWATLYQILVVNSGIRPLMSLMRGKLRRLGDMRGDKDIQVLADQGIELGEQMAEQQEEAAMAHLGEAV